MIEITANIDVDDLDKACEFYCKAFELTRGEMFGEHALELMGANCKLYLLAREPGSEPVKERPDKRDYGRHWTPVHLDFVVKNIESALERALQAGAKAETSIRSYDFGRIVVVADPWGHGHCIIEMKVK